MATSRPPPAMMGQSGCLIWQARAEKLKIPAHADKAFAVLFYDGQNKLASCGKEPVIRLWDAKSGEPLGTLEGHTAQVESIALSPRGDLLASASADKTAVLWNLARRKPARTLSRSPRARDGRVLFARWPLGGYRIERQYDRAVGSAHGRKIDAVAILDEVQSIAFSSDGGRLYAGDRSGSVHQYRVGADARGPPRAS